MIGDDLVPLLSQGPGPGLRFRQGQVVSWNAATGANTIDVAGSFLVDVPILNTGEAIALKAGHIVGLLAFQSSYWILGRITVPGDPNFASASVAFGGEGASATNFSVTTTLANKVTDTMAVPDWADEAIVLCTSNVSLYNSTAGPFYLTLRTTIDGVAGGSALFGLSALNPAANNSANDLNSAASSAQRLITNPGPTISLAAQLSVTGGTLPAHASNSAHLDCIAVFRSTV